ncbi:MAG: GTP 3',8-cyclase MoaA [Anaerolineae bacterium]
MVSNSTQSVRLHDQFGRHINYLRISLIDRCNLRCVYCMPTNGLRFLPNDKLLTVDEIELVARAAAGVGFRKIRFTGGEPTLRPELVEIVRRVGAVDGIDEITMTTNGTRLPQMARDLAEAGLRRVNVHIDTLNPKRLPLIMRWGSLEKLWSGIEAAEEAGLTPIKINCVVAKGYNDEDVVDLARLTLENDWYVRFIELMPLGRGPEAQFAVDKLVSSAETKARIETALGGLVHVPGDSPADESENFRLPAARGIIGFISPVSNPYCGTCNRMRLTADGKFHLCLLHDDEIDVKATIRNSGTIEDIQTILQRAVHQKPTGHALNEGVSAQERNMFQIGG